MAMEKLNVRFGDNTKQFISKIAGDLRMDDSSIARAAIVIGLECIAMSDNDTEDKIGVSDLVMSNQDVTDAELKRETEGDAKNQMDLLGE